MKKILLLSCLMIFPNNYGWYQDIVINGKIVETGLRSCSPTYAVLQKIFNQYQRPFTVLDLGAAQGFFSFKTAFDYPATCVMIEGNHNYQHAEKLLQLCKKNTELDSIIFLNQKMDLNYLTSLSEVEHFDVTLALNFIHHSGLDSKALIDCLVNMGDNLIIENPPHDEHSIEASEKIKRSGIDSYLSELGAVVIGTAPRHNLSPSESKIWWLHKPKSTLKRRHLHWPPPDYIGHVDDGKTHGIKSTFKIKKLIKTLDQGEIKTTWTPGINLVTFLSLGGVYPERNNLIEMLTPTLSIINNTWSASNLIISGAKPFTAIDFLDFSPISKRDYEEIKEKHYINLVQFLKQNKKLTYEDYWKKL